MTIVRVVQRQWICCNRLSDDKNIGGCQLVDWICVYDIWLSMFHIRMPLLLFVLAIVGGNLHVSVSDGFVNEKGRKKLHLKIILISDRVEEKCL